MRKYARGDVAVFAALLVGGVLLAVVWRVIDPATAKLGDNSETGAAVDGTLALLGVLAGILTGGSLILWPGSRPLLRTVVVVAGSALAGLIAWKLGDVFGKPHLRADGAAFTWPFTTCVAIFIGTLLPWSASTLNRSALGSVARDWTPIRSDRLAAETGWTGGGYRPPGESVPLDGHSAPPHAFGRPAPSGSQPGGSQPGDEPTGNDDQSPWHAPGA